LADRSSAPTSLTGIHQIQHVVVLMQENRSFDQYFGTFPGANGIPMSNGVPTVCIPNPNTGGCNRPYVDHADVQGGGPHGQGAAVTAIDSNKMDGFISVAETSARDCVDPMQVDCQRVPMDVIGYHTQGDIPNYWRYAQNFVLQDRMFEPITSYSLPEHLFQV
jgi:phospholipase C